MKGRTYKIVNPIRFFIFICICVFTLAFVGYTIINADSAQAASVNTYKQVVIHENESLWNSASEYCPNNMDMRDYIDDICEINDITSNDVFQPGDVVFVPIYS